MNRMEKEIRARLDRCAEAHTKGRLAQIERTLPVQAAGQLPVKSSRRYLVPGVAATSAAGALIVALVFFANKNGVLQMAARSETTSDVSVSSAAVSANGKTNLSGNSAARSSQTQNRPAFQAAQSARSQTTAAPKAASQQPKGTAHAAAGAIGGTLSWSVPNFVEYGGRVYFLRYDTAYGAAASNRVVRAAVCGKKLGSFSFGSTIHTVSGGQSAVTVSVFSVLGADVAQSVCITNPCAANDADHALFPSYTRMDFLVNSKFTADGTEYQLTGNVYSASGSVSGGGYAIDWYPDGVDQGHPTAGIVGNLPGGGTLYRIQKVETENAVYLNAAGLWFMIRKAGYGLPAGSAQSAASVVQRS